MRHTDRVTRFKRDKVRARPGPVRTVPTDLLDDTLLPTFFHSTLYMATLLEHWLVFQIWIEDRSHCKAGVPDLAVASPTSCDEDSIVAGIAFKQEALPPKSFSARELHWTPPVHAGRLH